MIEWITNWAQGIIIAVIIATIIEMILPNGSCKKYIKVVIGVYILFSIISPVISKITGKGFNISEELNLEEFYTEVDSKAIYNSLDKNNSNNIMDIYVSNLKSDIKIELNSETIVINYKNEALQFIDSPQSATLNNPYVYMGLQKALFQFIKNNSRNGEEEVDLESIDPPENGLDFKLYNLMKKKMITEVNIDNMDEVIYAISDKVIEKYCAAVRRLYSDGN